MKQRVIFLIKLYLLFLAFSLLSKIIFLVYHSDLITSNEGFSDIAKIFLYGLRLDLSASAYFMLLPLLMLIASALFRKDIFGLIIPVYFPIVITVLSLTLVTDLELYKFWGFRLDSTPFLYLKNPREAMASVSIWVIVRQIILAAFLAISFIWISRKILKKADSKYKFVEVPVYLFLFAFLIIPIRGGFGIAPINVGSAYFSQNSFLNHAAINVYWNLGNSFLEQGDKANKYKYFDENIANSLIEDYLNVNDSTGIKVLNTPKPNIIIVILESFTANAIKPLGGLPDVTPSLNALAQEGILFTNFYASGDRTDKGLVSVLSGYPAQATFSVIKDAAKTQSLPKLPVDLQKLGYNTAFYYGGDIDFANMRSYLVSAGFTDLISKEDFPSSTYNSKWGSHDDVVFNRLFNDLNKAKTPFFKVFLTLSSHEPFEVPTKHFKGNEDTPRFLNSMMYTDSCIGDFINKARLQPWWKDTWIIFVADHGSYHPEKLKVHVPKKFYIPMIWTGGAVIGPMKFEKPASQVDIPAMILYQLDRKFDQYRFSRNVFGNHQKTDVFYLFNNGIGMVNDTSKLVFDCTRQSLMLHYGPISDSLVNISKAYIQTIYSDLNKR